MHVIPQLRGLESKYRDEMVVVGVHSAKFPAERATANVREAVLRYGVAHPVINDRDFQVSQAYACRAWPTLMFIDPHGRVVGRHEGEAPMAELDVLLGRMLDEFRGAGLLHAQPLPLRLESELEAPSPLRFPGKVLADREGERLYIADSGHHRLLIASRDGEVRHVIGDGHPGMDDGNAAAAHFLAPQGMALDRDALYVADTGNHAIRRIDLASLTVRTVAGTGEQGFGARVGGPASSSAISSPWDVLAHDRILLIAMAGFHQIWALNIDAGTIEPWAGSGREDLVDGPPDTACFAQSSGLATDGARLFVADSETSSIRSVSFEDRHVATLVGRGLFEFGDEDGSGDDVLLQHALGVCWHDDEVYVADSYNNKVKRLPPNTRVCRSFVGATEGGRRDGSATDALLREPGGLSAAGDKLYVADTNNHAIRVVDLGSGAVTTLKLTGL